jgi:molybdopterin biosynthesis enzyme
VLSADDGQHRVRLLPTAGSHDLAAHGLANALARIPAGEGPVVAGTQVECILLESA